MTEPRPAPGGPLLAAVVLAVLPLAAQQPRLPASAPPAAQQPGSVEGTVLNAITGEPVGKAQVTLVQPGPGRQGPLEAASAPDGTFAITGVPAGQYRLAAEKVGFVRGAYGSRGISRTGAPVAVAAGQRVTGLQVRLTPQGVMTGRVLDEDGDPVLYAQVQALRYSYVQGTRRLMPASSAMTNDLGEFRLHSLEAGRYFLTASHRMRGRFGGRSGSGAPGDTNESYAPTYYPGTTDPATAATIQVTPGGTVRDLDVRLLKTPTFRISGRVVNPSAARPQRRAQVALVPRSSGGFLGGRNMAAAQPPDGRFEISGVSPGSYLLSATWWEDNSAAFGRLPVEVANSSLEGLVVTVMPAVQVAGRVRLDGGGSLDFSRIEFLFQPREMNPMAGGISARAKPDGALTIAHLMPDHYTLARAETPDGSYVKSMRFGDQDVLESGLNVAAGAQGSLDVVLSPGGAQVAGAVTNEKGEPVPGATVALVPEAARRRQSHLFRSAITDQYGSFTLQGLAPGDYRVFAWEEIEPGAWQDPDFLRAVEESGQSLSLREGARETRQLKTLPPPSPSD